MDAKVIRIVRREGWSCSPLGVFTHYPQGDYQVPDDMPPELARRCLNSGIGIAVQKKRETKAGPARKKKHSATKTGKRARS